MKSKTQKQLLYHFNFNENGNHVLYNYGQSNDINYSTQEKKFYQEYNVKSEISSPFFTFKVVPREILKPGQTFYVRFRSFNGVVGGYRSVRVSNVTDGSSLLRLRMQGVNKNRIVTYLNASVKILEQTKKDQKILYATNTKQYIDKLLKRESDSLKNLAVELRNYKNKNNI